jgi:hypothetical protein
MIRVWIHTTRIADSFCPPGIENQRYVLWVPLMMRISALRTVIARKLNLEESSLLLVLDRWMLDDGLTLADYAFVNTATIQVLIGALPPGAVRLQIAHGHSPLALVTENGSSVRSQVFASVPEWDPRACIVVDRRSRAVLGPVATIANFARHACVAVDVYHRDQSGIAVVSFAQPEEPPQPYAIEVGDRENVLALKCRLRTVTGVAAARQEILCDGVTWHDDRQIPRGRALELRVRERSGNAVSVHVSGAVIAVPIEDDSQLVSDLKFEVAQTLGIDADECGLAVSVREFRDEDATKEIWTLGISEYGTILEIPDGEDVVRVVVSTELCDVDVELPLAATVAVARKMIETVSGVNRGRHRYLVNGEFLTDDKALVGEIGIASGDKIFMI